MSTAIPPDSFSPNIGPRGTESQVQTTAQMEVPMDEDEINDISQMRTSSIWQKWIYYVVSWVMLFSSFAVIIAEMTSRHENGWGLAFIV